MFFATHPAHLCTQLKRFMLKATSIKVQISGLPLPQERGGVRRFAATAFPFVICLMISFLANAQPPSAQSDLFNILQNTCSNYLDVTANDNPDSLSIPQLQIITQPQNGNASVNGNYLSYCPQAGYLGADQFQYAVGDSFRTDTATVYINVLQPNNQINAGDADQNGKVENFDVLAIGLAYGTLGPARLDSVSNASLAWLPLSYVNSDPGAADCNGDGIVDASDAAVVDNNFLDTFNVLKPYDVDTSVCSADGISFSIESLPGDSIYDGDTLTLSINLGNSGVLNEAYGIAFTLEFDNRFIAGSQIQFQTADSWLLQNDTGLFFKKDFQQTAEVQLALTKTNHLIAGGGGEILSAILPIDDNIDGIAVAPGWHDLKLALAKVRLVSEYDIVREVCVEPSEIRIYKVATGIPQRNEPGVKIYPNPSEGKLWIEGSGLREVEIADLSGKNVFRTHAASDRIEIEAKLVPGVYLISVKTHDSVITKKLFIQP